MRSVQGIRNVLALPAAALLAAVVGVGCGGAQASSGPGPTDRPQPVATTVVGDGLLPGDQRAPNPASVTTTAPHWPIGRPQRPVLPHAPITRPPLQIQGVVTTTSTSPATTTTSEPTATTTAPSS